MGKALIVTGSSRGIGAATARLAAARGYHVCINCHHSAAAADALADEIAAAGGRAIVVPADMAREEDILRLFETCDRELGALAGLVNNAGITGPVRRVAEIDRDSLRQVLEINVIGAFLCAREAVKRLSTRSGGAGGAIVNVSSRASELGGANEWVHYGASKGAIDSLTAGLAKEVAGEGIRVNAVNPGLIDTEIHARAGLPDRLERLLHQVPMGRPGSAEEVAETILWLLSDAASYVTGITVPISGGR